MRTLLLCFIVLAACSKKDTRPAVDIKVIEGSSNLPVSGARVHLYTCRSNCVPMIPGSGDGVFQGVTNDSGICKVPAQLYDAANNMTVSHPDYWGFQPQFGTTIIMTPTGILQLHLRKRSNYPFDSYILLTLHGETGRINSFSMDMVSAVDTIIFPLCFGGEQNKLDWEVFKASSSIRSGTMNVQIPRFDTLKNVTLDF